MLKQTLAMSLPAQNSACACPYALIQASCLCLDTSAQQRHFHREGDTLPFSSIPGLRADAFTLDSYLEPTWSFGATAASLSSMESDFSASTTFNPVPRSLQGHRCQL